MLNALTCFLSRSLVHKVNSWPKVVPHSFSRDGVTIRMPHAPVELYVTINVLVPSRWRLLRHRGRAKGLLGYDLGWSLLRLRRRICVLLLLRRLLLVVYSRRVLLREFLLSAGIALWLLDGLELSLRRPLVHYGQCRTRLHGMSFPAACLSLVPFLHPPLIL